jgi:hypothetical protein
VLFAVSGGGTGAPTTGAQFGFNLVRGSFAGGFEVSTGALVASTGAAAMVFANARAGLLAGQRALIYAETGFGLLFAGATIPAFTFGGGIEFGLNNHLSASFEFKGVSGLSPGPPLFDAYQLEWALNWHP